MQLTGELSKVSLPNLIQLVRNGELTGKVSFLNGAKTAIIYFDRGAVIHVESEGHVGKDALMELFLWVNGSFSFVEDPLANVTRTVNPFLPEESVERLLRDGIAYVEQKKFLDQLRISGQTILRPTDQIQRASKNLLMIASPILEKINGQISLSEALSNSTLSRREYVQAAFACISEGLAVVVEAPLPATQKQIDLPPWVIARLQQDNADISQAIVDLVIWVDRVKCWMYQADVDFGRIVTELAKADQFDADEDFFRDLGQDHPDFQGPFFGESMPGGATPEPSPHAAQQAGQSVEPKIVAAPKPPSVEF